ncbi:MAG: Phosphoribosylaminoimidazolesuccinocarboxamide synthase [Bacteroidota bacterium]
MTNIPSLKQFEFPNQTAYYKGKVRDVYSFGNKLLMITSNRISAFDVILPRPIPYKGQVLNQIAQEFLRATEDIVPNWLEANPDPNVAFGKKCTPIPIEMVIRGYVSGHLWRTYKSGKRELCGVSLPDGLKENDRLPMPIITPTTKASEGHDEDISVNEILNQNIVSKELWNELDRITQALYKRGQEIANSRGLILVDTKYEFGLDENGKITLMDEIHTPDSSRYFYQNTYQELLDKDLPQKQLSKEFVREWLMENGFSGKEGQSIPEMSDEFVNQVSERYITLFEEITGKKFQREDQMNINERINQNILIFLEKNV